MHQCVSWCLCWVCVCVCAGRPKHHCAAATTGPLLPPHTHHNKEQLNTAALPAEEPTASRTSTNRQICLKPKGRSNKSQPTECKPLPCRPPDSNQRLCCLTSAYRSLSLLSPVYCQISGFILFFNIKKWQKHICMCSSYCCSYVQHLIYF